MIAESSGFNLAAYAERVEKMTDDELLAKGKDIHDRSLSRGKKLPSQEERGCEFFSAASARVGLAAVFLFVNRIRHPLAGAVHPTANKIEFVFSCQSQNKSTGASELLLSRPVGLKARPGRLALKKLL